MKVKDDRSMPDAGRVRTDGKHLNLEGSPFRVHGVTYGTFEARGDGALFPGADRVRADFAAMAAAGLNVVRTYTVPPADVLEQAEEAGLRVLVGLYYDDWRSERTPGRHARRRVLDAGRRAIAEAMERLAGRASILAVSVGNEVPGDVVRLHGIAAVEDALSQLVAEVHDADPAMLATYTNYPTTEYLRVEGEDVTTFNVFLERHEQLAPYLRHLQVVSGDRPLVLSEVGLAAAVHGAEAQAESLRWQLRAMDEAGCAGATVFAWTDEWNVAGHPVEGWGFGLTDADRSPKPALEVVGAWARTSTPKLRRAWPRVSVVVCAHNGDHLLDSCLRSLADCAYPDLEVVVCDDGSTDDTAEVARRFPFQVLRLPRGGLSAARNAGVAASTGEIVAFLDADAQCHPEWPYHLALSLEDPEVAAAGGPNFPVSGVGLVERAVAASPGGPVEVLVADDRAEHVPGCNMAFRREVLDEIDGFEPAHTAAGDDVDACWKILDRGRAIAFSPAAQVRHHRRDTVRAYLRQQAGYGRAEGMLSGAHPHRFNALGQARWRGFIYGGARLFASLLRPVVYHGAMGSAPFQPVVARRGEAAVVLASAYLPLLAPLAALGILAPLSAWWLAAPILATFAAAVYAAVVAASVRPSRHEPRPLRIPALVAALHLAQPFARTWGRLRTRPLAEPAKQRPDWSGDRLSWLAALEQELRGAARRVRRGGATDAWDVEVSIALVSHRLVTAVVWGWEPAWRAGARPSRLLVLLAAGGTLAAVAVTPWSAAVLAVLAGAAVAEAAYLRSFARRAVEDTAETVAEADIPAARLPARLPRSPIPGEAYE